MCLKKIVLLKYSLLKAEYARFKILYRNKVEDSFKLNNEVTSSFKSKKKL